MLLRNEREHEDESRCKKHKHKVRIGFERDITNGMRYITIEATLVIKLTTGKVCVCVCVRAHTHTHAHSSVEQYQNIKEHLFLQL